jgi:hypothetical protein
MIRRGVLVGVGVTWLEANGPQAKIGVIRRASKPGQEIKNRFILTKKPQLI